MKPDITDRDHLDEVNELILRLCVHIRADFGRKCTDYDKNCIVCRVYEALELLEEQYTSDE